MPKWGWALIIFGCGGLLLVALAFVAIFAAILFPVFAQAREKARTMSCLANVKQLSAAMVMYSQDYDGRFPRATVWMDAIRPRITKETVYHCPSVRGSGPSSFGYAFNSNLTGKKAAAIPNPAAARMLYDSSNLARNASDPVTSLANPPRHGSGNILGYADGHAQWLRYGGTMSPSPSPGGG
jgi:prepilin-type processing-associated H-X9-DG protein